MTYFPPPTNTQYLRRRRGLTMLDLVITVLIIGVLTAVAAPRFAENLQRHRANEAAKRVIADLRYARQHALSSSTPQTVQFDTSGSSYTISGVTNLDRPGQLYAVKLSLYPYKAALVSALFGADSDVEFDRFGQPDSDGSVTVKAGAYSRTIFLDSSSGLATAP